VQVSDLDLIVTRIGGGGFPAHVRKRSRKFGLEVQHDGILDGGDSRGLRSVMFLATE